MDFNYINGKVLQATDIDSAFLTRVQVTSTHTKITSRTHHATRETKGIVRQYSFSCPIIVLKEIVLTHETTI